MGYILLIELLNTKPNLQYLLHILLKWIWITGLFGLTRSSVIMDLCRHIRCNILPLHYGWCCTLKTYDERIISMTFVISKYLSCLQNNTNLKWVKYALLQLFRGQYFSALSAKFSCVVVWRPIRCHLNFRATDIYTVNWLPYRCHSLIIHASICWLSL